MSMEWWSMSHYPFVFMNNSVRKHTAYYCVFLHSFHHDRFYLDHHTTIHHPILTSEIVNGGVLGVCNISVIFIWNQLERNREIFPLEVISRFIFSDWFVRFGIQRGNGNSNKFLQEPVNLLQQTLQPLLRSPKPPRSLFLSLLFPFSNSLYPLLSIIHSHQFANVQLTTSPPATFLPATYRLPFPPPPSNVADDIPGYRNHETMTITMTTMMMALPLCPTAITSKREGNKISVSAATSYASLSLSMQYAFVYVLCFVNS